MFGPRRSDTNFKNLFKVPCALDVSAVMPSKIGLLADQGHHSVDPFWVLQAGQSTVQRFAYVAKPVPALQGVTASAHAARYFRELRASNTFVCWQVIRRARHFGGLAQPSSYFLSFTYFHFDFFFGFMSSLTNAISSSNALAILFRVLLSIIISFCYS